MSIVLWVFSSSAAAAGFDHFITADGTGLKDGNNNYDYLVHARYRLRPEAGAKYLRADFNSTSEIVRAELDYRPTSMAGGQLNHRFLSFFEERFSSITITYRW